MGLRDLSQFSRDSVTIPSGPDILQRKLRGGVSVWIGQAYRSAAEALFKLLVIMNFGGRNPRSRATFQAKFGVTLWILVLVRC